MLMGSRHLLSIVAAVLSVAACSKPTGKAPVEDTNAHADTKGVQPVASAPTVNALLAREKQASEAYARGDGSFFETFLSDNPVMVESGARLDKTDLIKKISGVKCEVKDGWALTEPHLQKINDDAYVLSYVSTMDSSCTAAGKTFTPPSPVRASTLWVRDGEKWQAAFHGANLIFDPANPPATEKHDAPGKQNTTAAATDSSTATAPATPSAAPITDALMAAENKLWQAWMEKDTGKIEGLTAADISFVNIFGTFFPNKAAAVADWTGKTCQVTSFALTDGVGTLVLPTVGVLTLKGTVNGACGGQDISGQVIYGNTIYVKDGDAWKWVFGFNSPS